MNVRNFFVIAMTVEVPNGEARSLRLSKGLFGAIFTKSPKISLYLRQRESLWHQPCVTVLRRNFVFIQKNIKNLAAFCALKMVVVSHFGIKTKFIVFYFNGLNNMFFFKKLECIVNCSFRKGWVNRIKCIVNSFNIGVNRMLAQIAVNSRSLNRWPYSRIL